MNEVKQWFLDQSPRDQMMLAIGGGLVALYLLLFMVLFPMQNDLHKKQLRNNAVLNEQQQVYILAGQVMARQQSGGNSNSSGLNGLLNQSLGEYGLRMENFQPSGNSARIRLGSSDFNQVLAWLNEMEVKQGVTVKDITITAESSPGAVLVNLQLVQGE